MRTIAFVRAMRPCALSLILLSCMVGMLPAQVPPHPDLLAKIKSGEVQRPAFMTDIASLRQRGIDASWSAPELSLRKPGVVQSSQRLFGPAAPPTGNWKVLIILVQWSDHPSVIGAARFDTIGFGASECTLRDYFRVVSYGNLNLVTLNPPGSLGWVTASQPYAYYANGTFGWGQYPRNSQRLVEEAVVALDPVVDFSQYDNDHDGYVDALLVVHAGNDAAWSGDPGDIWSHAWSTSQTITVDGVRVKNYAITSEYISQSRIVGISTLAHEYAHAEFGLPDLYDLDGSSLGLGNWSLMAGGCWGGIGPAGHYPVYPDAWSRTQMGFMAPVNMTNNVSGAMLRASERYPDAYRLGSGGGIGPEYFLVENREPFDYDRSVGTPVGGLLVYHVDESVLTGNNREWYPGHTSDGHYLVALEQADGRWQLEHGASSFSEDMYIQGRKFTASSIPDSRDYAGNCTGVSIVNISPGGTSMTATLHVTERQLVVLSPNGGEVWKPGTIRSVSWKSAFVSSLKLDYSTDAGTSWIEIANGIPYTTTRYDWLVPPAGSNRCLLRITDAYDPQTGDTSDGMFTVSNGGSPSDIVLGVDTVSSGSAAGAVYAWSQNAVPLVAGDEYTATFPSVVAIAETVGLGRVVAFGTDGFLLNMESEDNLRFAVNAADWLDRQHRRVIRVATGHAEYIAFDHDHFTDRLAQIGYDVGEIPGRMTDSNLVGAGVVLVGDIIDRGSLNAAEIDALVRYVKGGGGLLLTGSSENWSAFSMGHPLTEYPMNLIGGALGFQWAAGVIRDSVHFYQGRHLFMNFAPQTHVQLQTLPNACTYIDSAAHSYGNYLASVVQQDVVVRTRLEHADAFIARAPGAAPDITPPRQQVFDFYISLIGNYYSYQKDFYYDSNTRSGMLWLRERACRTLVDALPLTPSVKSAIASAVHIESGYARIWTDFSVVVLDNHSLSPPQRDFLWRLLGALPAGIHDLRAVAAPDLLGTTSPSVSLEGAGGDINIGSVQIGAASDNPFPDDAGSQQVDRFSIGVVHQVNRLIEWNLRAHDNVIHVRFIDLYMAAGSDQRNYLWRVPPDGYVQSQPFDFLASIGDVWFTNTRRTLNLAVARHGAGRSSPANQFLFFAEIYSCGGDSTSFFTMDVQGGILAERIPVQHDANGHITRMVVDGVTYDFTLDGQGNVLAIALPIQLEYFKATASTGGGVLLAWKTVSETNNYGFEIQKAAVPPAYVTIPGSFVAGHGTTTDPHEYSWTDRTDDRSSYYRLKQIDLDGSVRYSEGVRVGGTLSVDDLPVPKVLVLEQNYPNPANPGTVIRYGIPRASHVVLTLYNPLGQRVLVCVDREEDAGFHEVRIDVRNLASGVYFYTLSAEQFVQTKRLLVLK